MYFKFLQPLNARPPTSVMFSGIITVSTPVLENTSSSIILRDVGIVISVNEVQCKNAPSPKVSRFSGSVTNASEHP